MIRIIDEASPCAMTEIDIYKQNVKQLQEQLQNAYIRIKEQNEFIAEQNDFVSVIHTAYMKSLKEYIPNAKLSTKREQS